jgi:arsenate reductase (thioredoxin)
MGGGRFQAVSAGSHPRGTVHPLALDALRRRGVPAAGLRSKSWDEFAAPGAPVLDQIITVCDNAAQEACPLWPGHPATAHWSIPDPAAVTGTGADAAFESAYRDLESRIRALIASTST